MLALGACVSACRGARDERPPATAAADAPAPLVIGACRRPDGGAELCSNAVRTYDFGGGAGPFTLTVAARGPAPDSMRVALRVLRNDTTFYRADWSTALYAKYDSAPVSPDSARRRVERHLAALFADSAFRPTSALLGGAGDRGLREAVEFDVAVDGERRRRGLTPADTLPTDAAQSPRLVNDTTRVRALVSELRDAPAFRYYAGGEATYAIAWSAAERRFVVVYACC